MKKYIEKAKMDKRYEEVAALRANLEMLEDELRKQRKKEQETS